jgi:hypothetical protein
VTITHRKTKPPLNDLHKWAATASGDAPTEGEAIEKALRDLMLFLLEHSVDLRDRVWIESSRVIRTNNRFSHFVILKCRVMQRGTGGTSARTLLSERT